jgi:hypothetical protein
MSHPGFVVKSAVTMRTNPLRKRYRERLAGVNVGPWTSPSPTGPTMASPTTRDRPCARPWRRDGRRLATIAALGDGGPRPVGTQMVFAEGVVSGFLSGGCVEGDVAGHARACLADGAPRRLVYGEGSPWPDIRLLCGARIEILVERVAPDDAAAAELFRLMDARRPAVWVSDGARRACAEAVEPLAGRDRQAARSGLAAGGDRRRSDRPGHRPAGRPVGVRDHLWCGRAVLRSRRR